MGGSPAGSSCGMMSKNSSSKSRTVGGNSDVVSSVLHFMTSVTISPHSFASIRNWSLLIVRKLAFFASDVVSGGRSPAGSSVTFHSCHQNVYVLSHPLYVASTSYCQGLPSNT